MLLLQNVRVSEKALLLILLLPMMMCGRGHAAFDLIGLAREARPAVGHVTVFDSDGRELSTATGFLVSADGLLLTNYHVVDEAYSISVRFTAQSHSAVLTAADPVNDVALLRLDGQDFPFLPLGDSEVVEVGQRLAVIGSPLGLEGTLSEGIVAAIRKIRDWERCFQISAPISLGSSGSPVLNEAGRVIAVATFHMQGGEALNFAVPIEAGRRLLEGEIYCPPEIEFSPPPIIASRDSIPSDARAWRFVALRRIEQGALAAALEAWQAAVRLDPDNPQGWELLGLAGLQAGRADLGTAAYLRLLDLAPERAREMARLLPKPEPAVQPINTERMEREARSKPSTGN